MSDEDNLSREEVDAESPETVALAREMGWKPESEWRGDPPKGGHISATEFIRRGEKILPIVNARAKKAEARAAELERELRESREEHRQNLARIERVTAATLENQRLQITAQYTQRKEAAVEVGDKEAYRQADKDEREALKAIDDRLKEEPNDKKGEEKPRELPREVKAVIDEWIGENSWFNTNKRMNAYANTVHADLLAEKPGLSLRENLEEVRKEVVKRFPEAFKSADVDDDEEDETPRRRGSPVEGGSRMNGGGGSSAWAKVPQADRQRAENAGHIQYFLKPGETMEKDGAKAKDRWAKAYFGDDQ